MFIIRVHFIAYIYLSHHISFVRYLPLDFIFTCHYLICVCMLMSLNYFRFNVQPYCRERGKCTISRADAARHQYQPPLQLRFEHHHRVRRHPQQSRRGQRGEPSDRATRLGRQRLERISTWRLLSTTGQDYSTSSTNYRPYPYFMISR